MDTNRTIKGALDEAAADGALDADAHLALRAELDAVQLDAARYRGLRLIICEQDEDAQVRMFEAIDKIMSNLPDIKEAPTPERVDELFDMLIATAAGARDANG